MGLAALLCKIPPWPPPVLGVEVGVRTIGAGKPLASALIRGLQRGLPTTMTDAEKPVGSLFLEGGWQDPLALILI